jgi:hypothetical protein
MSVSLRLCSLRCATKLCKTRTSAVFDV